ncbi:rho GTPase-activating protein 31 [Neosynchiropus ocellatus]
MKNKGTKQKSKKKGNDNAFGCDLTEHLQTSGRDVPQVLQKCAEFIEKHGIVDGIYRLSGVTSNIQRLRQEFSSEACPDLTKEVYLQDIHCVGSLCKLYFRELPNPLLTYELYGKFTETVSVCGDHERLLHIQRVIKELPSPHFRTLEFLTKHLARLATLSSKTNMHTRNLALVWAPNLLRSKTIESSAGNGDMAFQEVRIQQSVVEFILNHTEQLFNDSAIVKPKDGPHVMCGEKYATLPISGQCGPMKLMSLEEAQARSLSPNHPVHKERQRENSLPDTSTAALYHTVIDLSDNKIARRRKLNGKTRKWKSIFNLGRSVDSKGKLSRNGSVFIRTGSTEKTALRPSRSMESLCSLTTDEGQSGNNSTASSSNSIQNMKSRTLGSDSLHDLSENDQKWDFKGKKSGGATGGWGSINQKSPAGASGSPQKSLPEQLKVFKGDDLRGNQPTSPKNRRMLYSGASQSGSSRPSFPGSFFPLESSPRHQRRAVNISEPFAVSVPLRVSAVISTNSTPCRNLAKDKAAPLKPFKETSEPSSSCGKSNTVPQLDSKKQEGTEKKDTEELVDSVPGEADTSSKSVQGDEKGKHKTELANVTEERTTAPSAEEQLNNQFSVWHQSETSSSGDDLWSDLSQELKIIEPEIDLLDKASKPVFSSCNNMKLTMDVKSKRSRSSPSLTLLCREKSSPIMDHVVVESSKKQPSEPDVMFHKSLEELVAGNKESIFLKSDDKEKRSLPISPLRKFNSIECKVLPLPLRDNAPGERENLPTPGGGLTAAPEHHTKSDQSQFPEAQNTDVGKKTTLPEFELIQRLSVCLEERPNTLQIPDDDDEGHHEELDLVESWEDLSSNKQWVTSPLHSPDVEELLNKLSPFLTPGRGLQSEEASMSFSTQPFSKGADPYPGPVPPPPSSKPDAKRTYLPTVPMRVSSSSTQAMHQRYFQPADQNLI